MKHKFTRFNIHTADLSTLKATSFIIKLPTKDLFSEKETLENENPNGASQLYYPPQRLRRIPKLHINNIISRRLHPYFPNFFTISTSVLTALVSSSLVLISSEDIVSYLLAISSKLTLTSSCMLLISEFTDFTSSCML